MKYIIWVSVVLISLVACKGDSANQEATDKSADIPLDTELENNASDESTLEITEDQGASQVKEDPDNTTTKEKPKSAPKPEAQVKKEGLEQVNTEPAAPGNNTPPRPEKEKTKGNVQQVDVIPVKDNTQGRPGKQVDNAHSIFDKLLSQHVSSDGMVNYKSWSKDTGMLDQYLAQLDATDVESLNKNQQLAFWINAYNAYTIRLILNHYPLQSISQINNGKPWDIKWLNLNGFNLSLNEIENEIIRPQFKDGRIHFALNCAARSCPPLLNRAYTGSNVDKLLDQQTKNFIGDKKYNQFSQSPIRISKIFEWYQEDFGNVIDFLNYYGNLEISSTENVFFNSYDWRLNEQ